MSPPVGPTGIQTCRGDAVADEDGNGDGEGAGAAHTWRVGVTYGFTSTRVLFDTSATAGAAGTTSAPFTKHAASASLEHAFGARLAVQLAAGATMAGALTFDAVDHDVLPGPFAAAAVALRAVDERDGVPFVLLTASLGAGAARTRARSPAGAGAPAETLLSYDGRVGIAVGKTLAGVVSPYAAARAFGLPVVWQRRGGTLTGTDAFHVQVGAGLAVRVGDFDVILEAAPVGERAFTAGAGWAL